MKYLNNLFVILFLFVGCTYYQAIYDITLSEVERPSDAKERYGESNIVSFEEEGKTKYSFEDEMIKIIWIPTSVHFYFFLTNKTSHSIKIIWDEAVYVNENGISQRVIHSGVKYEDKNNSQPPTTVVRLATVSDKILPTGNVYFVSGKYSKWKKKHLFPKLFDDSEQELINKTKKYVGKKVQILLPLRIEDVVNEYIFIFKINVENKLI